VTLIVGHVYSYQCNWITPPHRKMGVVVSSRANWIMWFNSEPRFHRIAQLDVVQGEHPVCTRACYLDLSAVQQVRLDEAKLAVDEGRLSNALLQRILDELRLPNRLLPTFKRQQIIANLEQA